MYLLYLLNPYVGMTLRVSSAFFAWVGQQQGPLDLTVEFQPGPEISAATRTSLLEVSRGN